MNKILYLNYVKNYNKTDKYILHISVHLQTKLFEDIDTFY